MTMIKVYTTFEEILLCYKRNVQFYLTVDQQLLAGRILWLDLQVSYYILRLYDEGERKIY